MALSDTSHSRNTAAVPIGAEFERWMKQAVYTSHTLTKDLWMPPSSSTLWILEVFSRVQSSEIDDDDGFSVLFVVLSRGQPCRFPPHHFAFAPCVWTFSSDLLNLLITSWFDYENFIICIYM
jgi:hypothetical protein